MRAKGLLARVPCNVTLATTVLELDYFFKNCFTSPMTSTKRMSTYWFSKNPAFVGGTPRPCCVAGRTSLLRVPSASSGPHVLHKHTLGRGLAGTRKIAAGHGKLSLIKNIFHLRRAELFAAHKPDYLHPAPPPHTHHRDHERRAHRQRWQCHGWRLRVRAATPACQECWRQRPDLACQVDGVVVALATAAGTGPTTATAATCPTPAGPANMVIVRAPSGDHFSWSQCERALPHPAAYPTNSQHRRLAGNALVPSRNVVCTRRVAGSETCAACAGNPRAPIAVGPGLSACR